MPLAELGDGALRTHRPRHGHAQKLHAVTPCKHHLGRAEAHLDLADGAGRTLARDFAIRSGHRLLVNTPSLDLDDAVRVATVDARIAELQRDPPATWVRLDI